jgi:hypothetical protein
MTPVGLPHSGIHGSKPAYDSPWHFAVNRALHRLLAPRHPPYALNSLTYVSLLLGLFRNFRSDVNSFDFYSILSLCSFQRTFAHSFTSSPRCRETVLSVNLFALA